MQKHSRLLAACVAAMVTITPALARASGDDKPADKPAEKVADKAADQSVSTPGTVDVGGQHIAYTAVTGTITVGATNEQDAQLGPDGKPLPDTNLAAEVANAKDASQAPPLARMF